MAFKNKKAIAATDQVPRSSAKVKDPTWKYAQIVPDPGYSPIVHRYAAHIRTGHYPVVGTGVPAFRDACKEALEEVEFRNMTLKDGPDYNTVADFLESTSVERTITSYRLKRKDNG